MWQQFEKDFKPYFPNFLTEIGILTVSHGLSAKANIKKLANLANLANLAQVLLQTNFKVYIQGRKLYGEIVGL